MNKKIVLILFFIISFKAFAQSEGVKLIITDESIDSSELSKKYDVTHKKDAAPFMVKREARDEFLKDVKAAEQWDELTKDIFYSDLKAKSLKELTKKYPDVKEEQLEALKGKRK